MKGTGAKLNVCPGSCVSTGAKFPVAPEESAPMHPTTQFFTGRMPFLPPNQQRQSTEGMSVKQTAAKSGIKLICLVRLTDFDEYNEDEEESQDEWLLDVFKLQVHNRDAVWMMTSVVVVMGDVCSTVIHITFNLHSIRTTTG